MNRTKYSNLFLIAVLKLEKEDGYVYSRSGVENYIKTVLVEEDICPYDVDDLNEICDRTKSRAVTDLIDLNLITQYYNPTETLKQLFEFDVEKGTNSSSKPFINHHSDEREGKNGN